MIPAIMKTEIYQILPLLRINKNNNERISFKSIKNVTIK